MKEADDLFDPLLDLNATVNDLSRSWHVLKQTAATWNLKDALKHAERLGPLVGRLAVNWPMAEQELAKVSAGIREKLVSPDYATGLENEMRTAGIRFSGEFPVYDLPPFRLTVSLEDFEAKLALGRKSERTADLNPQQLAKWVGVRYKKVLSRKFNAMAFLKDLLEAYRVSNRLNYRGKEITWGCAVPIMDLYEIMTLKQTARQDYPKQFFVFDLGLLKESSMLELNEFRFELGFARNQARAIVVVDSSGRESRISSLTVYKGEGDE
jgi:hypothetical protein